MRQVVSWVLVFMVGLSGSWAAERPVKAAGVGHLAAAPKAEPGPKEKVVLVKVKERDKTISYKLMSLDEYKTLGKEISDEMKLFAKAFGEAEDAWKKDEQLKSKPFPRSAIAERSAQQIAVFTDRTKAEAKLKFYEDQQMSAEKKEQDTAKERSKGKDKAALDKEKSREQDRENLYAQARTFFENKLTELKNPAKKDDKPDAGPAVPKADAAPKLPAN